MLPPDPWSVLFILIPLVSGSSILRGIWVMVAVLCPWKVATAANIQGKTMEHNHSEHLHFAFGKMRLNLSGYIPGWGGMNEAGTYLKRSEPDSNTLWSFVLTRIGEVAL